MSTTPCSFHRYLGGGREGAADAAIALKAFAEHKSNGAPDPSPGPPAVDLLGAGGGNAFQLAKDKAKQLQQVAFASNEHLTTHPFSHPIITPLQHTSSTLTGGTGT